MDDNNTFENVPGEKLAPEPSEADLTRADKWQSAMASDDVPAFAGDTSTELAPTELAPTELTPTEPITEPTPEDQELETQNNEGLIDAAAIINYGLNAAAREYGVEMVVQKIKSFDATGSEDPIRDLFLYLGIDTPAEFKDVKMEKEAARPKEADFYENSPVAPATKKRSTEGAFQAIKDMKELIQEVEGADPRYEQLREEAKTAGKGYFEYAVGSRVNKGLTDLFNTLAETPSSEEINTPKTTI